MSYEAATYINQLDRNLPRGSDSVSEGDIHIRTIKEVLKNSFPNVDVPVNAIHTGATEPVLHSAGTVWFDTSSGLVKLRSADDSEWINMAHGAANGLGSLLEVSWFEWPGEDVTKRNEDQELLQSWSISPLSPNSAMLITIAADVTAWGYSAEQACYVQIKDVTTDVILTPEHTACGFKNVDDIGNFEVSSQMYLRGRYNNHPAGAFELGLYGRTNNGADGGYNIKRVTVQCDELE